MYSQDKDDDDELTPEEKEQRQENFFRLLIHLFDRFAAEEQIPDNKIGFVTPNCFFQWLRKLELTLDAHALCAELDVAPGALSHLIDLAHSQAGPQLLSGIWAKVVLHNRPLPRVALKRLVVNALLHFADETTTVINMQVPDFTINGPFSDSTLVLALQGLSSNFQNYVIESGLEGLKQSAEPATQESYNLFMGLILRNIRQLAEPHKSNMMRWFRTVQLLIFPPIPQVVKDRMAGELARLTESPSAPPPEPTGGFDG